MKMDNEIIIASGNKGKIKEAQDILAEYKILPIKELGIDIEDVTKSGKGSELVVSKTKWGAENVELGGMTRDVNTLAGCINKVHDLMGMIITSKNNSQV